MPCASPLEEGGSWRFANAAIGTECDEELDSEFPLGAWPFGCGQPQLLLFGTLLAIRSIFVCQFRKGSFRRRAILKQSSIVKMVVVAWYMDDDVATDQRAPHKRSPNVPVPKEHLDKLGVLQWHLDADKYVARRLFRPHRAPRP